VGCVAELGSFGGLGDRWAINEMTISRPHSKSEIADALTALRRDGLRYWSDIVPEQFASPLGSAWSPADNVRHLAKATAPVAQALRVPRVALIIFGAARGPSRTFDELRQTYLGVLSKGATAGRFAPSPTTPPADVRNWQKHLIGRCAGSIERLERGLEPWSESDLDRYRLPHPLLGRLTVREMLLFTLYHFEHHKSNVVRRIGSSEGPPS
jgi:hypothetical protein